jgi:flagellin-like hook-associated protein FlgL
MSAAVISLSQGLRNSVYSMTEISEQINVANNRLATGRKVNSALDNAGAYFKSQGLQKESRDFGSLLDGLERGSKIIKKATDAIGSIRKLFEAAQALARQARQLADTDTSRNTLRNQIAELATQASRLAYDSGFDGSKLTQTDATVLPNVVINTNPSVTTPTTITLVAQDFRLDQAGGLANFTVGTTGLTVTTTAGQPQSVAGTTDWALATSNGLIDATITQFSTSLTLLEARGSAIATQSSVVDIRKEFIRSGQRANNELSDYLILADLNEEGANLTSLQTKQQLAVTALSLAGRTDQAILRLFG